MQPFTCEYLIFSPLVDVITKKRTYWFAFLVKLSRVYLLSVICLSRDKIQLQSLFHQHFGLIFYGRVAF